MLPKIIAIIDDELEMEDIYALILDPLLSTNVAEIKYFSDSHKFLEWFEHHPVDLLLCDIDMPQMDGPELCQIIRQSGQSIQICFVSGHSPPDYAGVMEKLQISHFLTKPLDAVEVLSFCKQELGLLPVNS